MQGCPFCQPQQDMEQQVVLRNKYCLFLQNPKHQEVLVGSGIIVPIAHRETVFDLAPEEWEATYDLLQQVKTLLDEKYHPQGYNVGWNVRQAGGQHILHAHLHVIPRFSNEPHAGRGIRHWLKQIDNKR